MTQSDPSRAPIQALIADDIEANVTVLRKVLQRAGYQVHAANNGKQAMDILRSVAIDLIISDILMPVMDGYELCRQCQQDEALSRIPFIFYTATYTTADDRAFGLSLGAARFIIKPAKHAEFLQEIAAVLTEFKDNRLPGPAATPSLSNGVYRNEHTSRLIHKLEHKLGQLQQAEADLTAANARLEATSNLLQKIIESLPARVFWKDRDLCYLGCNPLFARDAGFADAQDLVGKTDFDMSWKDQAELYRADDRAVMESGTGKLGYEEPQTTPDGATKWLSTSKVPLHNSQHEIIGMLGIYTEITERKQAEHKLRLAASVFEHAGEGIIITDPDGAILDVNQSFCRITGYARDEVLGRNPSLLSSGLHDPIFFKTLWRALSEPGYWHGEIVNRRKTGEEFTTMQSISAVQDSQGKTVQYVSVMTDITAAKAHQRQLEHIAHYDVLTGLPNRVLLADRLHQAMAQAHRRQEKLAVVYLDLDGFKTVNDNHGHDVGDLLLSAVATRMKHSLREGDTLARLGGDEFVAVLINLDNLEASVPLLLRLLKEAAEPTQIGDLMLQVSASIGVTLYPQPDPIEPDQLLRQADQAMYQAKLAGKNRYHVFDAEQDRSTRGRHESVERMRAALRSREFVLYYQPKVNMRSGQLIGVEALIRWQHPEQGLSSPAQFLPVIESHPLAVELGEWVIETALVQLEAWKAVGLSVPVVCVNVGAQQLQQPDFVDRLKTILDRHLDIDPSELELELLETSALIDIEQMSWVIKACRDLGVSCALDDFGTGYSSLTYLKRLPTETLKIDQSFIHDMPNDPEDLAILEGVLGLASAFGRRVIAEGVETVAHGIMLLQLGCELAQGYSIARPMPADQLPGWLSAWQTDPAWASQPVLSSDQLAMLRAGIAHCAWVRNIKKVLKGDTGAQSNLDHQQCDFGRWLVSSDWQAPIGQPCLQDLIGHHNDVHRLAEDLLRLRGQGLKDEALARTGELDAILDAMLEALKQLLSASHTREA